MVIFSAVLPSVSSPDLGNAPVVAAGALVFSSFIFTIAAQGSQNPAFPYLFPLTLD